MLMRRSCRPPSGAQSVCSYTQAAAARKAGIAQAKREAGHNARDKAGYEAQAAMRRAGIAQGKREAGYRNIKVEGITTGGDSLSRLGPLPKVKNYDPLLGGAAAKQ